MLPPAELHNGRLQHHGPSLCPVNMFKTVPSFQIQITWIFPAGPSNKSGSEFKSQNATSPDGIRARDKLKSIRVTRSPKV